jgi:hypothetical protein
VLEDLYSAGAIRTLVTGSLLVPPAAPPDIGRVIASGLLPTKMLAAEALGAAGASGQAAIIDLRYGSEALGAAATALEQFHPPREVLVRCYHYLRDHSRGTSWAWPPEHAPDHGAAGLTMDALNAALGIFLEAGIVTAEGGEGAVHYQVTDSAGRVDLERSLRYREGARERAAWSDLRAWAEGPAAAILADLARA